MAPKPANGQLLSDGMLRDSKVFQDKKIVPAQLSINLPGVTIQLPIPVPVPAPIYIPPAQDDTVWFQNNECWVTGGVLNCYPGVVLMAIPLGVVVIDPTVLIYPGLYIGPDIRWGGRWARGDEIGRYHERHNAGDFRRPEGRGPERGHGPEVGHEQGRQPDFRRPEVRQEQHTPAVGRPQGSPQAHQQAPKREEQRR
jgi:hypothetical protein